MTGEWCICNIERYAVYNDNIHTHTYIHQSQLIDNQLFSYNIENNGYSFIDHYQLFRKYVIIIMAK